MYNIIKNEEIDKQSWNKLLLASPTASWFQSYDCYEFYKKNDVMKPFALGVNMNGELVALVCGYIIADGGFIKRFMSRRAIILGGPIFHPLVSEEAVGLLLQQLQKNLDSKSIYVEIRNFHDYGIYKNVFEKWKFQYQPHLNFHLNSSDCDVAFNNLKPNKRRYIRLSVKEGTEWHITEDKNEITDLYNILKQLYQQKVKTPLFSLSFFHTLSEVTNTKFLVVKYNNKIVGGGVFVVLSEKCIYEWFVCGEDRQYKNVYPSICATWGGIEYAAQNGIPLFDFMGAGKPDIEYGVRDFKAEFGGTLVEHGRFCYVANPMLFFIGRLGVKLLKHLK